MWPHFKVLKLFESLRREINLIFSLKVRCSKLPYNRCSHVMNMDVFQVFSRISQETFQKSDDFVEKERKERFLSIISTQRCQHNETFQQSYYTEQHGCNKLRKTSTLVYCI